MILISIEAFEKNGRTKDKAFINKFKLQTIDDFNILQDVKPVGWNSRVTVNIKVRPRVTGQRQRSF